MSTRRFALVGLVALALLPLLSLVSAQQAVPAGDAQAAAQAAVLTAPLPSDPQVTVGQFANGLRYYIRVNKKPENRAELRLVVNAGSVLEENDQLGLAHMVEHMAFNGTKHFAKQEIVSFMESIGMRFGPSLNAFTSFDETVYMLQVPTDKPAVLEKSFLILEDWAHNLSFDPAEIDKERGVIVEEWRQGRGASARLQDKQFPVLFKGSRYAERLPIGKKETIETFKHDRLKAFYADWYRPDLMAVVAVGDFDKAAIEALIKGHFAALPPAKAPKPRPVFQLPDHPDTYYTVATDKEATVTGVAVYNLLPYRDPSTIGAYRRQITEQLFTGMLNRRLQELAQKADPPFLFAGGGRGQVVRAREMSSLNAAVKEGGVERGLEAMLVEAERVARFGFTATELDRQKRDVLRQMERVFTERDKQESSSLASEYVRHFTQREPFPGIAYEYGLYQRFVPEVTLEDINALGKTWMSDRSRVVMVQGPEKAGVAMPEEATLSGVIKAVAGKDVAAYVDTVAGQTLMDSLPQPGKVVKSTPREPYGITEWELSNGVKVVLKPTTFKQDEIVFRATSPGGSSLASDADYIPASTAAQVVSAGGLGKFSSIELQKVLAGKAAVVRPGIGELEEGLMGSASPKDLETMFQLIYLSFTAPRADPTIFGVLTSQMKTMLGNQAASPAFAFAEAIQTTLYQNHPRARPLTPDDIDRMNLEKSFAFYKDRFADAGDFTFVFVGTFEPDALKPLIERYLASLPSTHRSETWKNVNMVPVKGVVQKVVKKGIEQQSQAAIVFTGPMKYTRDEQVAIRALGMVLSTTLRETLREDLSGTYGVNVTPAAQPIPEGRYSFAIRFGCNPARTDELVKAVFTQIEALRANGPTEKQVADVKEALIREFETSSKQNGFLLAQIYQRYQVPADLGEFFSLPEFYKTGVTAALVHDAARTYLNTANYVQVTLMPEK
jgi:zinc protease